MYLTPNSILRGSNAPVYTHYSRLLSVWHIMVHCSKFRNQQLRYHFDGKSNDILGDEGNVGYPQVIKVFNI